MEVDTDDLSLVERVTLLSIADAVIAGDAPVDSLALRERVVELLESVDATTVGELQEGDVIRALNVLGPKPYVAETQSATSPTGKGRPRYSLKSDVDNLLDELAADDRLHELTEEISE